jgi:YcxB-like protein
MEVQAVNRTADEFLTTMAVSDDEVIRGSVRFCEADIRHGLVEMRPFLKLYRLFGLGMLGATAALGAFSDSSESGQWTLFCVGLAAACALSAGAGCHQARSMLAAQHLDEGDVHYRFDQGGMTICAPGRSNSTTYRVMHRFREGRQSFLLYAGPHLASIVPKRAFAAEDLPRLRALLAGNVEPHRAVSPSHLLLFGTMSAVFVTLLWGVLTRLAGG